MPELPDVESFERYLDATSLHQRIAHVNVLSAYVLKGISARELALRLKGRCFESSRRHGKHLFVHTDGKALPSHALHLGKSDRDQSGCRADAEVVAAAAPWKRREVSALRA